MMEKMQWEKAPDIEKKLRKILSSGIFPHINAQKITALRGFGSTSRAIARIWSLPRPWQLALAVDPQYVIEVIAERFDRQSPTEQEKTLVHELMHIPKSFSGALVSHRNRGRQINSHNVDLLYDHLITRRQSSR